jgi:hypothetical protein
LLYCLQQHMKFAWCNLFTNTKASQLIWLQRDQKKHDGNSEFEHIISTSKMADQLNMVACGSICHHNSHMYWILACRFLNFTLNKSIFALFYIFAMILSLFSYNRFSSSCGSGWKEWKTCYIYVNLFNYIQLHKTRRWWWCCRFAWKHRKFWLLLMKRM